MFLGYFIIHSLFFHNPSHVSTVENLNHIQQSFCKTLINPWKLEPCYNMSKVLLNIKHTSKEMSVFRSLHMQFGDPSSSLFYFQLQVLA